MDVVEKRAGRTRLDMLGDLVQEHIPMGSEPAGEDYRTLLWAHETIRHLRSIRDDTIEECAKVAEALQSSTSQIKLHMSEMTAQETRAVKACLSLSAHLIRSLKSKDVDKDKP